MRLRVSLLQALSVVRGREYIHIHMHTCIMYIYNCINFYIYLQIHEVTLIPLIPIKQHRIPSRFLPFHIYWASLLQPLSSVGASHPRLMLRLIPCTGLGTPTAMHLPHSGAYTTPGHFPCIEDSLTSLGLQYPALGLFLYRWPLLPA